MQMDGAAAANGACGDIAHAVQILRNGGLVAFPTETVYGLGADASSPQAVARIFAAKGRPADHPLIVHLGSADLLTHWAREVPAVAFDLAQRFWPGPLTLILRRAAHVPDAVTGGQDTVGLRVPGHPLALALLRAFGSGIAAPSANRFGRVSPTRASHVLEELGDSVELILDGGACEVGLESTIVDLSGASPRLLRPGAITSDALAGVLGAAPGGRGVDAPRTPGDLASHYAPRTPVQLVPQDWCPGADAAAAGATAVLSLQAQPGALAASWRWVRMPDDALGYGRVLYATLREADAWGCVRILVESPPAGAHWHAVHDRLQRAAHGGAERLP